MEPRREIEESISHPGFESITRDATRPDLRQRTEGKTGDANRRLNYRELLAEQAQYHVVHGVDTGRHSGKRPTVLMPAVSFLR